MKSPQRRDAASKVGKLAEIAAALRRGECVEVTRLTTIKSLCADTKVAARFAAFLAGKTLRRVEGGSMRSGRLPRADARLHRQLMRDAVLAMKTWLASPTEARSQRLWELLRQMEEAQNEYKRSKWGSVRVIRNADLLLVEYALRCILRPDAALAYQTARHYAERHESSSAAGLTRASTPLVQDIVDFFAAAFAVDREALEAPVKQKHTPKSTARGQRSPARGGAGSADGGAKFTHRQGQFLAFIDLFRKLHRRGPSEAEMIEFFRLTPPSVHDMVVRLERLGLVTRQPGVPRSIRVAIAEDQIPTLEGVEGGPW